MTNPFYVLSILLSGFLAFYSCSLIIKVLINSLAIRNHRIKSFLMLVPFFSLMIDFFINKYSIGTWINPLNCTSCVQKFFLETFYPHLKAYLSENHISLVHYLGCEFQHGLFAYFSMSIAFISLVFVTYKLIQTLLLALSIRTLFKKSYVSDRLIENTQLRKKLKEYHAKIYISKECQIPFASYNKAIIIPKTIEEILTPTEFEAVVAHELEHIKYNDSIVRLFYNLIAIIFWWVPTAFWRKSIEREQELACDKNVLNYGLNRECLASAIFKVTKQTKENPSLCYFVNQRNPIKARVQAILGLQMQVEQKILGFNLIGAAGILFLFMCFFL